MDDGALDPQYSYFKTLGLTLRYIFHFTSARRYPLSYVFSGNYYWGGGTLYYQDSYGRWWSTTASSDSNAYYLLMHSSLLSPQDYSNKAGGFSLRCVSLGFTFSRRYPLSYVFAGYYTWINAILGNQGDGSGYYSATASNNRASRMAVFPGSLIYSDDTLNKNYGYSLRRRRVKPNTLSLVFLGLRSLLPPTLK
ncbi:hypothetical protein IJH16_01170 [Candidatus Saccharibacteria bacterium]|nr:hypothetical protein [Candidatus Saccharibacteria bacterium]